MSLLPLKVTDGRYANETGVVVATSEIAGERVVLMLTDLNHRELTVRAEVSSGQDKLQGYELHDLVVVAYGLEELLMVSLLLLE